MVTASEMRYIWKEVGKTMRENSRNAAIVDELEQTPIIGQRKKIEVVWKMKRKSETRMGDNKKIY